MSSLFAPSWYRVATLRPRLRTQARITRHVYRNERWYVLQDLGSGRFLRLNAKAYRLVALMDGLRTLDEIWRQACLTDGDSAPTQDEVLNLLAQLHSINALISDQRPDLDEMKVRGDKSRRQKLKQYIANPLSLKIPLVDPDRWLGRLVGLCSWSTWKLLALLWGGLVISALIGAVYAWEVLTEDLAARSFTPENVLLLALVFPVLKIVHEIGHGIAIKLFGGACREMGLMLLVFLPIPYVDASQATAFPDKRRRMFVGAAGMIAELGVAALAFWLWSWAEPGLFKSVLHQTIILSSVTTLFFNANPLLRFDGYYILADWLEIPNLGNKANNYLGYVLSRHVFHSHRIEPPAMGAREKPWLLGYAVASYLYRVTVALAIILLVADGFFFIGVLLAFWAGWNMLLLPILRQFKHLAVHPALEEVRGRAWAMTLGAILLLGAILFWLPAPAWTSAEGVIWMTDDARVRARHPCFGKGVLAPPGMAVRQGQPLLDCGDPELDAKIIESQARLEELATRFSLALGTDRVQMMVIDAERQHAQASHQDLLTRQVALQLTSPHDGVFHIERPADFPGRYIERGEQVAHVLDAGRVTLLTVVPQGDADQVRQHTERVELRVAGDIWTPINASIRREVPAATRELPSLALSLGGGGKIGLDPNATASGEAAALVPLFQFELALPSGYPLGLMGTRVYVRFVHANEPLARQWYRGLRQLFLKRFTW